VQEDEDGSDWQKQWRKQGCQHGETYAAEPGRAWLDMTKLVGLGRKRRKPKQAEQFPRTAETNGK
jgi:hypothetical protein